MEKKPLYRKVNKRTHDGWAWYYYRKERYRFERHKKSYTQAAKMPIKKHSMFRTGYDYTPLFRFLHSHVGNVWADIFCECQARLNDIEPLTWMVVNVNKHGLVVDNYLPNGESREYFRVGESYWSTLYVDEDGVLQFVDKDFYRPHSVQMGEINYFDTTESWNGEPQYPNDETI